MNRQVKRGEIWFAKLDNKKVKGEQCGDRPVLILQDDELNDKLETVIVATITSQIKNQQHCHLPVKLNKPSMIKLEQVKTISKDRLLSRSKKLNKLEMLMVDGRLMRVLGLR